MGTTVRPYKNSSAAKKEQVARMFNNIAWRYDFLNRFLSLGIDRAWRRKAISMLRPFRPRIILDIATGTADLAIESLKLDPEQVIGVDISVDMLKIGREKLRNKGLDSRISLLEGDSERLIFEDNKFDAVTVAFGVRNFEHLENGLREILRVLRPGGAVMILEFSQPRNPLMNGLYTFYSTRITPWFGRKISKDPQAYTYLHESIAAFPSGQDFLKILESCGFRQAAAKPMTFGVVSVYTGIKP
jgi:demethylmenaquinone methyltransferase/2-methoxy-6-polyprenyl-1,4-benzoquinol methylase